MRTQVNKPPDTGPKSKPGEFGRWMKAAQGLFLPGSIPSAIGTYRLLRRRYPDRFVAGVTIVLSAVPSVALIALTGYVPVWGRLLRAVLSNLSTWLFRMAGADTQPYLPYPAGWPMVLAVGLFVGPAFGAAWWWTSQRRREASPFNGEEEKAQRVAAEERRRKRVAHWAQERHHTGSRMVSAVTKPLAVDPGGPLGPVLGHYLRGDLPRPWRTRRGRFLLPMGHERNRHLVLLGATGLGKSETAWAMAEWAMAQGWQVIYLTAKEPQSAKTSAAPRLAAAAEAHGKTFKQLVQSSKDRTGSPYDPMRGARKQVQNRLTAIEEWGDSYWEHCANLLVGMALNLAEQTGQPLRSFPQLVTKMVYSNLEEQARHSNDPDITMLVKALSKEAVSGAVIRYASLANHLAEWIGPREANGWAIEDADVACIELPMLREPKVGRALLRLVLKDITAYSADPNRRRQMPDGSAQPMMIIIDEVGPFASDPIVGNDFMELTERGRSGSMYAVLIAQDPTGIGDMDRLSRIVTNAVVATYAQGPQAEVVANWIGTRLHNEAGADYDNEGTYSHQGVMRRQHTFKVGPQDLKELGMGEMYVFGAGRFAKVVTTRTKLGFAQTATPLVAAVMEELEAARYDPAAAAYSAPRAVVPPSRPPLDDGAAAAPSRRPRWIGTGPDSTTAEGGRALSLGGGPVLSGTVHPAETPRRKPDTDRGDQGDEELYDRPY